MSGHDFSRAAKPLYVEAASEALRNGDAMLQDPSSIAKYYRQAFDLLNQKKNEYGNGVVVRNCKTEARKLHDLGHKLAGGK
jgi:hypothetical protein